MHKSIKHILIIFILFFPISAFSFDAVPSKTKVVCTIGPASNTKEQLGKLMDAGMNVARLNFSHGSHKEYAEIIANIKAVRKAKGKALAILLDTKGPEIRVGQLPDGKIELKEGEKYWLVKDVESGSVNQIPFNPFTVVNDVKKGTTVLFNDGAISSTVLSVNPRKGILIKVNNGGPLKSRKGINIPNTKLSLPNVMDQDVKDIRFGCKHGIDVIALSFTRSPSHIEEVRKILASEKREDVLLIAKIENFEGIENLDSIIEASDGIMVARGDLGVELPLHKVPQFQKEIIYKTYLGGKPSITATQMLESMIDNPRPTRAEVSDVANAAYDSSSAVMLSGETAVGKYPIECVEAMKTITSEVENNFDYESFFIKTLKLPSIDITSSIATAAVRSAYNTKAKAIFALTETGNIVRYITRQRPSIPVMAFTANERTFNRLALYWGVTPVLVSKKAILKNENFPKLSNLAISKGFAKNGDLVVITTQSDKKGNNSDIMLIKKIRKK